MKRARLLNVNRRHAVAPTINQSMPYSRFPGYNVCVCEHVIYGLVSSSPFPSPGRQSSSGTSVKNRHLRVNTLWRKRDLASIPPPYCPYQFHFISKTIFVVENSFVQLDLRVKTLFVLEKE